MFKYNFLKKAEEEGRIIAEAKNFEGETIIFLIPEERPTSIELFILGQRGGWGGKAYIPDFEFNKLVASLQTFLESENPHFVGMKYDPKSDEITWVE